jgi:3'-5' exoribonuclease
MFPEALLLHYLDDLDSKMEAMRAQFERGGDSEGAWTAYNPSLGRPLLNTAKFLAQKESQESEEEIDPLQRVDQSTVSVEIEVTPILTGPDTTEKETAEKENTNSTMTSTVHEDKI